MSSKIEIDFSEVKAFLEKTTKAASGDFKREAAAIVEEIGNNLLSTIESEIIKHKSVNTRKLLGSFKKGGSENVWEISDDGLTLEVGTNVEYAKFVNDGHWMNSPGVEMRFVPGMWSGGKFTYSPGAKTGMMLRQQWVEGKHFMESAVRIVEKMIPDLLESRIQQWLDNYFS